MSAPARRGPKAKISRQVIAEAAIAVGFDKATLQSVAEHLGMDHSSLYRHVKGRDEVLLLGADLAIGQVDWAFDHDDWRDYLTAAAQATWTLCRTHTGLAEIIRTMTHTPPNAIRVFGRMIRKMTSCGFAIEDAAVIVDSIFDMTVDSVIGWERMDKSIGPHGTVADDMVRSWNEVAESEAEMFAEIDIMSRIMRQSPDAWWHRKLTLLLDGATQLAPQTN